MSNINWGQFLNNFANNFNRLGADNVQNLLNETFMEQTEQNSTAQTLFLSNTQSQLSQTTAELASLNQQQTITMLKDLLNLSKTFDSFLSGLITDSQELNEQNVLSLLASDMNLNQLSSLLQNNSKIAMSNLYRMLAEYNKVGVSLKDEQISTLSKLISFISASSTSDVQALKTIMLMYLPWLPLTDTNAFKLEITNSQSGSGASDTDSVSILISTENYGNLQADIFKTEEDGIKIELISSETFPQTKFADLMKEESAKYNININLIQTQKQSLTKEKNKKSETQVCINTSPGVNPFLLLISNALIRNVHIIDSNEKLRQLRKEKFNG
ncbi:MAG: hypothetical protein LUH11_02095 [Candidatus Gastranaerophilales bacterium]|nr:hypothetical protein [Candidatus Gastranaerophilales bacterium]